ncbi:MAG: holdfast anchoring protein HfaA [Alphaproteobacteria bacterium]|jgi:holdfast attachment protein HfaA
MSVRTKALSTLLAAAAALTLISPVSALTVRRSSGDGADVMARPYGTAPGEENQPMTGSTRDANGNRVIVNGSYVDDTYSSESGGLHYGVSRGTTGASTNATAVGNLLNVVVSGKYNTVIVNSTQDNSGDQTVILNGGLKLD